MTTKIASLGIPGDVIMSAGAGLDFSADSKGKFRGFEACMYRLASNSAGGNIDIGIAAAADWVVATEKLPTDANLVTRGADASTTDYVFGFSATGYFLVLGQFELYDASAAGQVSYIIFKTTDDNGATAYDGIGRSMGNLYTSNTHNTVPGFALLAITDTANQKFKISKAQTTGTTILIGDPSVSCTALLFVKIADI